MPRSAQNGRTESAGDVHQEKNRRRELDGGDDGVPAIRSSTA